MPVFDSPVYKPAAIYMVSPGCNFVILKASFILLYAVWGVLPSPLTFIELLTYQLNVSIFEFKRST